MFLIIIGLMIIPIQSLQAQVVEGHKYYCWSGTLEAAGKTDKTTAVDLLLEYEPSTQLVMGEICYHREKKVKIRLYGQATTNKKGYLFSLFEVLPSSSCTGKLTLQITDDQCSDAKWESLYFYNQIYPDWEKEKSVKKKLTLSESKPFPYQEVSSFFQPLDKQRLTGVFTLNNSGGEVFHNYDKVEISPLSDSLYIANFSINDYFNDDDFFIILRKVDDQLLEIKSEAQKLHISAKVLADCVCFNIFIDKNHLFDHIKPVYIRQPDLESFIYPHINNKKHTLSNYITARLEGKQVKVLVNPLPLLMGNASNMANEMENFSSIETLTNIHNGAKRIFIGYAGEDEQPLLAILNRDSTVQVYSPIDGYLYRYSNVSEPIPGLTGIVDFAFEDPNETEEAKKQRTYSTFYAIDRNGKYHEVPINKYNNQISFSKKDPSGATKQHDIELSKDWSIHYKLEVDRDETFGPYTNEYYGYCWADEDDSSVIHYIFNQMLDTRDPGDYDFFKACRIKGSMRISTNQEGQFIIKPISGLRFN